MIYDNDGAMTASALAQKRYGSMVGFMVDSNLTPSITDHVLNEDELNEYKLHTCLDPRIWDKNNKLFPDVKDALLKIANLFLETLQGVLTLRDVRITGSEANYNYTESSDIDLHLVFDFSEINVDPEFLDDYFFSKRQIFNNQYSFTVKGVPVELSVENIDSSLISTGVYSLFTDSWLRIPENAGLEVTQFNLESYDRIVSAIRKIVASGDRERLYKLWKNIKALRKLSLKLQGEFGEGNLIFKKLRADGFIGMVKDALDAAVSRELSLYQVNNQDDYYFNNIPIYNNNGGLTDIKQDNNISIRGDIHSCKSI